MKDYFNQTRTAFRKMLNVEATQNQAVMVFAIIALPVFTVFAIISACTGLFR